jgi:hypothetical protein
MGVPEGIDEMQYSHRSQGARVWSLAWVQASQSESSSPNSLTFAPARRLSLTKYDNDPEHISARLETGWYYRSGPQDEWSYDPPDGRLSTVLDAGTLAPSGPILSRGEIGLQDALALEAMVARARELGWI